MRWARTLVVAAALAGATTTTAAAQIRGVQFTPDGKRVLVNKDVGSERWAITRNENGTVTGNVFRSDGGPPAFVFCSPLGPLDAYACFGADPCTDGSGAERNIQGVPDGTRVLTQKDVGSERWAISLNFDDGTATGNVFRADGREPAFLACTPNGTPNGFSCSGADRCLGTPCTAPFTPIGDVTLSASFFALPDSCAESYTPIGAVTLPSDFFEPATVAAVTFTVTATAPVQGFDIRVAYPLAKGSFAGTGEDVSCTIDTAATFTKNDRESDGTLILIVAGVSDLAFPVSVSCAFEAPDVAAGDFIVAVREVVQNGASVDPSILSVGLTVQ